MSVTTSGAEHLVVIKRDATARRPPHAIVDGDKLFLMAQVADLAAGQPVAAQTREILARIDSLLAEAGTGKFRLLMANIRLADMDTFAEMNGVWDEWLIDGQTPGRTTAEAKLASTEYAVEISVVVGRSPNGSERGLDD